MSDRISSYRKKKTSTGTFAVVTLPDTLGRRRDVLLGRYGTAASRQEYARVIAGQSNRHVGWKGLSDGNSSILSQAGFHALALDLQGYNVDLPACSRKGTTSTTRGMQP